MADQGGSTRLLRRTVVVVALVVLALVGSLWAVGASPSANPSANPPASSFGGASTSATAPPTNPTAPTSPPKTTSPTDAATGPPASDPLTLVGLGDSVPAAATCGCTGYVELLGTALHAATGRPVVVHNDSKGGWTTSDVEQDLSDGQTMADLSHADVVTVEIGANDFDLGPVDDPACLPVLPAQCWADTIADLSTGLTDIVSGIRDVDSDPDVHIALIGYWNVTVDGDVGAAQGQAFVAGSDALTRAVNTTIKTVATSTHCLYVDAYTPFKGDGSLDPTADLLPDGDHLSAKGHTVMAIAVFDTLREAGVVTALTPTP
ncbi:MAG: GDSL-type esterase/lipase family protein [Humibacillus sp.]|nr:GDSL-type esterase/lipase family protein [Humibacillus sp.]MDN5777746.1 GDSL-type esterase/lipase family protein [Humibacillus sp.]